MSAVATLRALDPSRHFLTIEDLAEYLCYRGPGAGNAAYQWCRRYAVPRVKRGNACLVRLSDVDAALAGVDLAARRAQEARTPRSFLKSHKA
jgi:hypothetical protein